MTTTTKLVTYPFPMNTAASAVAAIRLYGHPQPRLRRLAMAIRVFLRTYHPAIDPTWLKMPANAEEMERSLSHLTPRQIREFAISCDGYGGWGLGLDAVDSYLNLIVFKGGK